MDATGVPLFTLMNANLEEDVEELPMRTSSVSFIGDRLPAVILQLDWFTPVAHDPKAGEVPPSRHWVLVPAVTWARTPDAFVYRMPPFDVNVEKVIAPEADKVVTSLMAPEEISIPLIVSSVIVVITPVEETWKTSVVPEVRVPEISRFPVTVVLSRIDNRPDPESITTFPVVVLPRVKLCPFVVAKLPKPVKYVAMFPEFPEIVAVGVPEFTFTTANFEELVDTPPKRKSKVEESFGVIVPEAISQLLPAPAAQDDQVGLEAPEIRQSPVEAVVAWDRLFVASA